MKQGLRPKKHIVIRDLKRNVVQMTLKDRVIPGCLINSMIPERFLKEMNPNNPLELDEVHCWNTETQRWDSFLISELENYQTIGGEPRVKIDEERRTDGPDPRGTGNQDPEEKEET
jgi:hypothetical protein